MSPDLITRYFWILGILIPIIAGRAWWSHVQPLIKKDPSLESGYQRLYWGSVIALGIPSLIVGLGLMTGQVKSFSEFMIDRTDNPIVTLHWIVMIVLVALGTIWICLSGGAEMLERHPGFFGLPHLSARSLKQLCMVIVGFQLFAVLVIRPIVQSGAEGAPDTTETDQFPLWFPVFFIGLWFGVSYVLALLGGWHSLAKYYATDQSNIGTRFRFRSAQFNTLASYNSCLNFEAGPRGLLIRPLLLFRFFHPPLLISWDDIAVEEKSGWFSRSAEFRFSREPSVSMRIDRKLAEGLIKESGREIPVARPRA